jgi:hypothetical protein
MAARASKRSKDDPGAWVEYDGPGPLFMRAMQANAIDDSRLVRFARVVHWVMDSKGYPLFDAIHFACECMDRFEKNGSDILYAAQENTYARQCGPDVDFGYFTAENLNRAKQFVEPITRSRGVLKQPIRMANSARGDLLIRRAPLIVDSKSATRAMEFLAHVQPVVPGLPAATRYIREHWIAPGRYGKSSLVAGRGDMDIPDPDDTLVPVLSFLCQDARAIFGWPDVGGTQEAVQAPAPDTWTNQRIAERHAELKRQGVKNPTKRVAEEAGIGGKDPTGVVRNRMRLYRAAQKPSPLPAVNNVTRICAR